MIRKREREEKGLEGAPGGDEMESTDEEGAEAKDDSNITDPAKPISDSNGQSELYHGDPANGMMYDYCEEWSYDPRLLIKKDVAWLDQCRTLGFNPQTRKTFMSGIGTYDDGGSFAVREAGTDPNDPHPGTGYPCYTPNGLEFDGITFPLHEACYSILAKRLGYDDPADINRDALFETVRPIGEGNNDSLRVDYGCELSHQYWENRPGEEVYSNSISPVISADSLRTVCRYLSRGRGPRAAKHNLAAPACSTASRFASIRPFSQGPTRSAQHSTLRYPTHHSATPLYPRLSQPHASIPPRLHHHPGKHALEKHDPHASCPMALGDHRFG